MAQNVSVEQWTPHTLNEHNTGEVAEVAYWHYHTI